MLKLPIMLSSEKTKRNLMFDVVPRVMFESERGLEDNAKINLSCGNIFKFGLMVGLQSSKIAIYRAKFWMTF